MEGWEEVTVPVSVDKIGLFFRELQPDPSREHTTSNHPAFKVMLTCVAHKQGWDDEYIIIYTPI